MAEAGDPREAIRAALSTALNEEQVSTLVDEVLAIRKKAVGDFKCKKCGQNQRHNVEILDAVAVTKALTDWLNQGYGRPQEAAGTDDEKIVFTRIVNYPDAAPA